jgi:hypothetical protein
MRPWWGMAAPAPTTTLSAATTARAMSTEVPQLMRQALAGAKAVMDPAGIMNPGVLIDPAQHFVGITGGTVSAGENGDTAGWPATTK